MYTRSAFPVPMACFGSFGTHRGLLLYVFSCKKKRMTRKSPSFHIRLPPQSLEGAYSLKELLSVLVEVVGVVFGVGVEVVLRAEVPVAAVPASTALRASSGASLI